MMIRPIVTLLLALALLGVSLPAHSASPAKADAMEPPDAPSSTSGEIVFYGEERFRDNNDGTVTDLTTGLMWPTNASLADMRIPYQAAKKWVSKMNDGDAENYGYHDWRIPSIQELQGLVDKSQSSPALSVGHPFRNVQNGYYWSSTGGFNIVEYIWVMDLTYGLVKFDYPSYCNFQNLWPVRDAQ